ncbi:DSD1 family PLP-dependent enzyme [Jannaschia formosa]|uniref:DSD1 family PLP-dependent enzyme n=1 Tax=Jannaschia formosa TaxID=2259592 RepID=UPI000E1BA2C9|nr:DSD1 family PLP-dependent enzyme [Jannaschia formosa]TFL19370.1 DSD1 family PLP-dependent enzyme [Jannaschia formosa]
MSPDLPARPGQTEAEVLTPSLILDLGALERNVTRMGRLASEAGIGHRSHGKMHRSVDVQLLQQRLGGACGVCCQKVSEAEAFVAGGIADLLVTNQVRQPAMVDRLARLAGAARVAVCVDDPASVAELSEAATRHGSEIGVFVEMDVGQGRCGVATDAEVVDLARAAAQAPGLRFDGLQAYHGGMQHLPSAEARRETARGVADRVRRAKAALAEAGLPCPTVTGGGTGSWHEDAASGAFDEVQAGSYAFMDADYGRVPGARSARLDAEWENALFVLASVLSVKPGRAILDAGLKSMSGESGPPTVFGRKFEVVNLSDEHTVLADPANALKVGDRLRLIPGHCDPTCNLHDAYVCLRDGRVEALWPVSARGRSW